MKPAAFDYVRAESLEEALETMAEHGEDARVLAGGQSLGPMLNLRLAQPAVIVDIGRVPGLRQIEVDDSGVMTAANVTQAKLLHDQRLRAKQPLLAEAMPWIGHVQTRARGTVCGSLAHADPAAELPLLFSTMGGVAIARSKRGQRAIRSEAFYTGMFETALEPDEILIAVRFNAPTPGVGLAFEEVAERHGDFAIVAAAALADDEGVALGLGGVADTPLVFRWDDLDPSLIDQAAAELAASLEPRSDPRADSAYRRRLIAKLGARVMRKAAERRHAV